MIYFEPKFVLGALQPPQTSYCDKAGGLPWGLPRNKWPKCKDCKAPQTFLAQFKHDKVRLDLGKPGRVLFLFQCDNDPGMCETWDHNSGSNCGFILDAEQLTSGLTDTPSMQINVEPEGRVIEWIKRDDGVDEKDSPRFFQCRKYIDDEHDELLRRAHIGTHLNGLPWWVQPRRIPEDIGRFILQLSTVHSFEGPAPSVDQLRCQILYYSRSGRNGRVKKTNAKGFEPLGYPSWTRGQREFPGRPSQICVDGSNWYCETANFGGGLAYVFLEDQADPPRVVFLWQN